jgi:hypothetical protein
MERLKGAYKFRGNSWRSAITIKGINYFLGVFPSEELASKAYNKANDDFKTMRLLPSGEYLNVINNKKPTTNNKVDNNIVKADAKNRMLQHRYKLTPEEYCDMYVKQNKQCAICKKEFELGGRKGLYVDHCHTSGKVRGLLCPSCNSALGKFKDDVTILNKAIEYLTINK